MMARILEIGRRRLKNNVRRVSVKTTVPGTFHVGITNPLPLPQPLPSSVLTIDMSALSDVLRVIATTHRS
jgi:hypothetical protein